MSNQVFLPHQNYTLIVDTKIEINFKYIETNATKHLVLARFVILSRNFYTFSSILPLRSLTKLQHSNLMFIHNEYNNMLFVCARIKFLIN